MMKILTLALEMVSRAAAFVAAVLFVKRGENIEDLKDENKKLETTLEVVDGLHSLDVDARRRLLASWSRREVSGQAPPASNDIGYIKDE